MPAENLTTSSPPLKPYYEASGITIYHGDCRDILPLLEFNAIVSDPPYGLARPYGRSLEFVSGDATEELIDWLTHYFNGPMIVFSSWQWVPKRKPERQLVWDKGQLGLSGSDLPWLNSHEVAWVFGEGWQGRKRGTVFHSSREYMAQHPTQKPLDLIKWIVDAAQDQWVLCDPFMGSGTTLEAAKNLNRRAIGIDTEEWCCEITAKRLSQEVSQFA